jgi:signal peptidase II
MTPRAAGLVVAVTSFIADQAVKLWFLRVYDLAENGPVAVAPFAEFRLVWNYGISYGLLRQHETVGRVALIAFAVAAAVALTVWLWRQGRALPALSLGLVIGGAVGNALDRVPARPVVFVVCLQSGRRLDRRRCHRAPDRQCDRPQGCHKGRGIRS